MTTSEYAADIAYHLGTHRAEGRAIDEIEQQVKEADEANAEHTPTVEPVE